MKKIFILLVAVVLIAGVSITAVFAMQNMSAAGKEKCAISECSVKQDCPKYGECSVKGECQNTDLCRNQGTGACLNNAESNNGEQGQRMGNCMGGGMRRMGNGCGMRKGCDK
jgi:hypothetical protein